MRKKRRDHGSMEWTVESAETWLLLDDTEADLLHMERALALAVPSTTILVARSRREAFRILEANVIHACIFDYYMHNETADAFIGKVRRVHPQMPIIVVSHHTEKSDTIRSVGADWVVPKITEVGSYGEILFKSVRHAQALRRLKASPLSIPDLYVTEDREQEIRKAVDLPSGNIVVVGAAGMGRSCLGKTIAQKISERHAATFDLSVNVLSCKERLWDDQIDFEELLFGTKAGDGSKDGRSGMLERAQRGVLFIDDAEMLPIKIQEKLKHFFECFEMKMNNGFTLRADSFRLVLTVMEGPEKQALIPGFVSTVAKVRLNLPRMSALLLEEKKLVQFFLGKETNRRHQNKLRMDPEAKYALKARLLQFHDRATLRSLARTFEGAVDRAIAEGRTLLNLTDFRDFGLLDDLAVVSTVRNSGVGGFFEKDDAVGIEIWKTFYRIVQKGKLKEVTEEATRLAFRYRKIAEAGNMRNVAKSLTITRASLYKAPLNKIIEPLMGKS